MEVKQKNYGVRRVAEIAARVATLRAQLAPAIEVPRCLCCQSPAAFFLCDEAGQLLPDCTGFCEACAPAQQPDEQTPEAGTPAPLEAIESAARAFDAYKSDRASHAMLTESLQIEWETLRRDLAKLQAAEYDGAAYGVNLTEEIEAIETRLAELDEMLIFEPEFPFDFDDLPAADNV